MVVLKCPSVLDPTTFILFWNQADKYKPAMLENVVNMLFEASNPRSYWTLRA